MNERKRILQNTNPKNGGIARHAQDERRPSSSTGTKRHARDRRIANRTARRRMADAANETEQGA